MSALQNPQIGNTSLELSTDAAQQKYIAPFIAQMVADAAGTVGVLQRAAVTITGVDETFNLVLSEADSVKLLNAFRVYKTDNLSANDGVLTDSSAGVAVDIISSREVDFKAALRAALDSAKSDGQHYSVGLADSGEASDLSNCSIENYLKRETYIDTRDQLAYDTLANLLEASDLASFTMQLDVSGAAKNMYDQLNGSGVNAPRYRRTIFTQLPESNTEDYLLPKPTGDLSGNMNAEAVTDINFLPFRSGDRLFFVFDAVVGAAGIDGNGMFTAPTSGATIDRVLQDADYQNKVQVGSEGMAGLATLNANAGAEYAGQADTVTFTAPTKRRIGVGIQVAKGGAPAVPAPFNLLLKKGEETAVIDPSGAHYAYQVAAGLLTDVSEALCLTSSAPVAAPPAQAMGADVSGSSIDLAGVNLANGGHATQTIIANGLTNVATGGIFGKWMVVNAAGNKNQFVLNGAALEYHARIAVADHADTAKLYYVSNVELSGPRNVSCGAFYSTQA